MDYTPDIRDFARLCAEENERYVGDVLDESKMNRLNKMRALCRNAAESDPQIGVKTLPFSNRSRNGTAMLLLPSAFFCADRCALRSVSEAVALADALTVVSVGEQLRVSLIVLDMWSEYHLEQEK